MDIESLKWSAYEYERKEKSSDWIWAFWTLTITIVVISIFFNDILFAVFIIISAIAFSLYTNKSHTLHNFELNKKGVSIDNNLHQNSTIDSFWIEEEEGSRPKIILRSKKIFMPYIVIPIESIDPKEIREYLIKSIKEEKHEEPFVHRFVEHFGI